MYFAAAVVAGPESSELNWLLARVDNIGGWDGGGAAATRGWRKTLYKKARVLLQQVDLRCEREVSGATCCPRCKWEAPRRPLQ